MMYIYISIIYTYIYYIYRYQYTWINIYFTAYTILLDQCPAFVWHHNFGDPRHPRHWPCNNATRTPPIGGHDRLSKKGGDQIPHGSNMGVSKNRGTPKWMIYNGKPYWNGWFGGTNHFRKPPYIHGPWNNGWLKLYYCWWFRNPAITSWD